MWLYQNKEWNPSLEQITDNDLVGFVYIITHLETGKKYVGQKKLTTIQKKVVKGKTRKKRITKMSNWPDYWSSSKIINELVKTEGPEAFKREIIHLCESKSLMNWLELKEQLERNVLFTDEYMNGIVNIRCNERCIRKYAEKCKY